MLIIWRNIMFYRILYLNAWNEVESVYQEDLDDAERCLGYIQEVGLKVLDFCKVKSKPMWRENRYNRSNY